MMRLHLLLAGLASLLGFSWLSLDVLQEGVEHSLATAAESALHEHGYRGVKVRFDHLDGIVTGAESTEQLDEVCELILKTIPAGRIVFVQLRGDSSSKLVSPKKANQAPIEQLVENDISESDFDASAVIGELANDVKVAPDEATPGLGITNIGELDAIVTEPPFAWKEKDEDAQAPVSLDRILITTDRKPKLEVVAAEHPSGRDRLAEVSEVVTNQSRTTERDALPIHLSESDLDAMTAAVKAQDIGNDIAEPIVLARDPKLESDRAPQLALEPAMKPNLTDAVPAFNENAEPMTAPQVTEKPMSSVLLTKPTAAHTHAAKTSRPRLGVYLTSQPNDPVVRHIEKGSAAELAGIKVGDSIVRFGNRNITNFAELSEAVLRYGPGEMADVLLKRNRELLRRTVRLQHAESAKTTDQTSPEAIERVQ